MISYFIPIFLKLFLREAQREKTVQRETIMLCQTVTLATAIFLGNKTYEKQEAYREQLAWPTYCYVFWNKEALFVSLLVYKYSVISKISNLLKFPPKKSSSFLPVTEDMVCISYVDCCNVIFLFNSLSLGNNPFVFCLLASNCLILKKDCKFQNGKILNISTFLSIIIVSEPVQ